MSLKKFNEQRHNAKRRGIKFKFSYEEWVNWWEEHLGKNWLKKRGVGTGKYCMARIKDKGPYSINNVKCILFSDNTSESSINNSIAFGVKAGQSKLTDNIVKSIYTSKLPVKKLMEKYNITIGTVCDIRSRRTWKRVTEGIIRVSTLGRNQWQ